MHETQHKSLESLLDLPEGSGAFLEEALLGHSSEHCPEMDTLMDFADGSLQKSERRSVQAHLRECTDCAAVAADLYQMLAPTRDLHTGWFGWKGPWLAAKHKIQDEVTLNAWDQHGLHCDRCKQRQASLTWPVLAPRLAFAGSGAFASVLLMLIMLPFLRTPKAADTEVQNRTGIDKINGEYSKISDSGIPPNPLEFMQNFLRLEPEGAYVEPQRRAQAKHDIEIWSQLRDQFGYKDDIVVHGGLQRIYAWLERTETDPAEKKKYAEFNQQEKTRLAALIARLSQKQENKP